MRRFRYVFSWWFSILLVFFVLCNLIGLIRYMGVKPFRYTGFPFIIYFKASGFQESLSWLALGLNTLIALFVSSFVACVCAFARCGRPWRGTMADPRQASGRT